MADLRKPIGQKEVLVIAIGLVVGFALKDFIENFIMAFITPVLDKLMGGVGALESKVTEIGGIQFMPGQFVTGTINFFVILLVLFIMVRTFNTSVYQSNKSKDTKKK
ncbi:MAG: MscL family protein [Candidatus Nomurabacteria bacterium]|nr:MAG: MscL family protein [Candidatus Nomurabacteria bacterium]HRV75802.1 MscL family protein [Candidatus Saccharimonadales bacterium]